MAKEKFLIIAVPVPVDCFGRFSETANRAEIDAGTVDTSDSYSWIEKTFEYQLIRWREATHICSFTPSARYYFLQNYFVGIPNWAWEADGDEDGLESENGGEVGGYGTYRDDYDSRFIVETFTIDTMKHLDGLRKPRDMRSDKGEAYTEKVWTLAEETAREMQCNGLPEAPICNVWTYRQWERECSQRTRQRACDQSKRNAELWSLS
jgi:hypothetical protein